MQNKNQHYIYFFVSDKINFIDVCLLIQTSTESTLVQIIIIISKSDIFFWHGLYILEWNIDLFKFELILFS